jgi:hypothetical protein
MRMKTMAALAAALAITMAAPVLAGPAPKVKGKVEVEGTIVAVAPAPSTFTVQTTKGQTGTVVVLVQRATELKIKRKGGENEDEDEAREERARVPASLADFRVGDRVKVEGFRLDDGRLLALKVEVKNRVVARTQPHPPSEGLVAQGVVIARSRDTLTILEPGGASRLVIVPATVVVTGQRNSFAAIVLNDTARVEGTVNSDNSSITARQIEVVFANAFQIIGRITFKSAFPQFLIVNNSTSVNVAGDTRIVSGGQLRSFADLQVGQTITVSGTPMTAGGATIGVNAKVIAF